MRTYSPFGFALAALALLFFGPMGCAMQRAADAGAAQRHMVGMDKDAVFACMGIPKKKASEGETTIWLYPSSDGHAVKYKQGGSATLSGQIATTLGFGDEVKTRRFCTVQIVMREDRVVAVHYNGPTGGIMTEDEQCAYAVRNCLPR